jgi:hypothetical protein
MSEPHCSKVIQTREVAVVYRDAAITMIATIRCTADELRQWWIDEIGNAPGAKPGWRKKRVQPGRARISYGLTAMDCHLIERACKRRIEELQAWEAAYDRDWS